VPFFSIITSTYVKPDQLASRPQPLVLSGMQLENAAGYFLEKSKKIPNASAKKGR
jgi:hypothetical protein